MFREQTIEGPACRLALHAADGGGPPLMFMHGVLRAWHDFMCLVPALASRWRLFGLDHRGHGRSGHVARTTGDVYRAVDYAADAVAVIDAQFSDRPVVLFGHSLGALVSAAAAARRPECVRAIILEDPPFTLLQRGFEGSPYQEMFAAFRELARTTRSIDEMAAAIANTEVRGPGISGRMKLKLLRDAASIRYGARCLTQLDPKLLDPLVEGRLMDGYDYREILPQIRCPVLLLQGETELGGMLTDADAREAAALISRASHVKLPKVGHLIHQFETDSTIRLTLSFLESLE